MGKKRKNGKRTPTYHSWLAMRERCNREGHKQYSNYGGRGIRVCKRWDSFEAFLADMGERPEGMTIDRINNDGDYSPENCKWSSYSEQNFNKSTKVLLTFNGKTLHLTQWAKKLGIHVKTLTERIDRGLPEEKVFHAGPLQGKKTPAI